MARPAMGNNSGNKIGRFGAWCVEYGFYARDGVCGVSWHHFSNGIDVTFGGGGFYIFIQWIWREPEPWPEDGEP